MTTIGWILLVVSISSMECAQKLVDKEGNTPSTNHTISLSDADIVKLALVAVSIIGATMVQTWVIVTFAFLQMFSVVTRLQTGVPMLAFVEMLVLMLLATYRAEIQNWMRAPPPE